MAISAAAVGRTLAVVAGILALLATGWALRPVTAAGTAPQRLLPAVGDPTGSTAAAYPRQVRGSSSPSATGAGGLVWDTSRGYPVRVEPGHSPQPQPRVPGGAAAFTWLLAGERPGPPPARWSPCAPITVRVNPTGLGPASRAAIREAFAELQVRTGLLVRFGARTEETVTGRLATRAWRRGTWTTAWRPTWAPVLVFASDAARTPELAGSLVGWTHLRTSGVGPWRRIVSGVVALDMDDLGDTERGVGMLRLRMLLLHELGHLVGLGHVEDPGLVMHPRAAPSDGETATYRNGDLRGLAIAGRGPC